MYIKKRGWAAKANAKAAAASEANGNVGAMMSKDDFDHRLGNYQLMEAIGKGGYGTVYRGLNIERGMTVAVKRVNLRGIPQGELENIEMEIRLLQNLDHANIVKYLDSIRSDDYLNIVLEYVENGSLSSLLNKFHGGGGESKGFPEQLCSHYIKQVLKGLQYLHTQGVIHRDIKGANILSTKQGQIKLADFGVATKLNESGKSDSVVGTPYWMAPEIIERTGQQSSACDIWSVGCTCVELLTGKPPYFDLQQMPALFRIVVDEHPPLPSGISPALEDFLLNCFQKDPNRRIDAHGLLKHPWLTSSVEMIDDQEKVLVGSGMVEDNPIARTTSSSSKTLKDNTTNKEDDDQFGFFGEEEAQENKVEQVVNKMVPKNIPHTAIPDLSQMAPSMRKLEAFVDQDHDEVDEFDELIGDGGDLEVKLVTACAATSLVSNSNLVVRDLDGEVDPFDNITFEEGDDKADEVVLNRTFLRLIEFLSPDSSERAVLDSCDGLNELIKTHPEQVRSLMTTHGVVPIMELLLEVCNAHILLAVLKLVNNSVAMNQTFQQNMSLVGLIPAIIRFGGQSYPREIRLEAANFMRQFCYASDWTRKMFIACDGLPVLVSFLTEEYNQSKMLVWNAIDCIRHVFDITTSPKNDFCRLFCKFGLLEPLARTLSAVHLDKDSNDAPTFVFKIAGILHMFSQGDKVVKLHFAKPTVIESMLHVLPLVPQETLILLLKSIRNISMDSTTLDLLQVAGAIPALIPFLDAKAVSENQHQVLLTMYYLCQIKASRQEQAALSGIIPHLQRFIREKHPLKQFAYPIIFLLAKTSWRTRLELKKHQGLQFYTNILTSADVYWRSAALDCISVWLSASSDDTARVSFLLNTPSNINKLLRVFKDTEDTTQFDAMLLSFRKILASSLKVNQSLGRCKEFINEIKARLCRDTSSNNTRINLLKMLSLLFAAHPCPAQLAVDANLVPVFHSLLEDTSAVIVGSLTQKFLTQYIHTE